jgi:hypothetical protein
MSGALNFTLGLQVNKFLESSRISEILTSLEMAGALLDVSLGNVRDQLDHSGERGRLDGVPESDGNSESSGVLPTPATGTSARPFQSTGGAAAMLSGLFSDSGFVPPEPSQRRPIAQPVSATDRGNPIRERLLAVTNDLLGSAATGRDDTKTAAASQGFGFLNHTSDAKADPTTLEKLGFVFAGGASVNHAATTAKNTTQMAADLRIVAAAVSKTGGAEALTNAHA